MTSHGWAFRYMPALLCSNAWFLAVDVLRRTWLCGRTRCDGRHLLVLLNETYYLFRESSAYFGNQPGHEQSDESRYRPWTGTSQSLRFSYLVLHKLLLFSNLTVL